MLKMNDIKILRVLKWMFFISNIFLFSLFLYFGIINFITPNFPLDNSNIIIGSNIANFKSGIISNISYDSASIALYAFAIVFLIANIITNMIIQFGYDFNINKIKVVSWVTLGFNLDLFIIVSIFIFYRGKDFNIVDTSLVTKGIEITSILELVVNNNMTSFNISTLGIVYICIYAVSIIFLFLSIITYTLRLINRTYLFCRS